MKRIIIGSIIAIGLFVAQITQAQGTLYASNLGQTPTASGVVGNDSWLAQGFFTGTNSSGYALNSVQLLMDAASGSPSGFIVSIYSSSYNPPFPQFATPGNNLTNLSGFAPSAGGLFSYTPSSGLILLPDTFYFIVVTANTLVATGAYDWSAANFGLDPNNQWWLDNVYFSSTDGSNWAASRSHIFQLGIYATAVPEPSAISLILLGGGVLIYVRTRNKKHSAQAKSD